MDILNIIKTLYDKYKKVIIISSLIIVFSATCAFIAIKYNNKNNYVSQNNHNIIASIETASTEKTNEETTLFVDIKGNVDKPGVYEVKSTSRVKDVIAAAGGLLKNANTRYINMSKVVQDEMVIIIYSNEEIDAMKNDNVKTFIEYIEKPCQCDVSNDACIEKEDDSSLDSNDNNTSLININTATLEELTTLNGIGESKAEAIIKYREENGPFETIEDIKNVSGISDATFNNFKENITTK